MNYYALVVDTNMYAGNFEREMTTFCTGQTFPRGELYLEDDTPHSDWWASNSHDHWDGDEDSYPEACSIWPTPNWFNDGYGNQTELEPGSERPKKSYPAYNSVAMFCSEIPPLDVINAVKERANRFFDKYKEFDKYGLKEGEVLEIRGFRLITFYSGQNEQVI